MPPGTEGIGDGRISVANRISSAKTTAWPATEMKRGSLILSTAGAPLASPRKLREYHNQRNFAAASIAHRANGMWRNSRRT